MKKVDKVREMGKVLRGMAGIIICIVFAMGTIWYNTAANVSCLNSVSVKAATEEKTMTRTKQARIVIDAGHGGIDGGAVSPDGTLEKDINLEIAKKLRDTAQNYDVEVIMTRTDENGLYSEGKSIRQKHREDLARRKAIIDEAYPDVAVSIHLNSFPHDDKVCGAQVFYPIETVKEQEARTDEQKQKGCAKEYAEAVCKALKINGCNGKSREVKAKGDIYLFKQATVPTILVECGFISNQDELALLKTAEYQQLLSNAIWEGINEILCVAYREKQLIIDSTNKPQI